MSIVVRVCVKRVAVLLRLVSEGVDLQVSDRANNTEIIRHV